MAKPKIYMFYPLVLATLPVLSLYATNVTELEPNYFTLLYLTVFSIIATSVLWLIALAITRSIPKSIILAVAVMLVFFYSGRIHSVIANFLFNLGPITIGPLKLTAAIALTLVAGTYLLLRKVREEKLQKINKLFSTLTVILITVSLFTIILGELSKGNSPASTQMASELSTSAPTLNPLPDIYYIIFDGYAREDYLKEYFGHDNSEFIQHLREKGFYVADESNSNYAHSFLSIPAALNMKFLNYLKDTQQNNPTDASILYQLLREHQTASTFRTFGYKYVNIGSTWDPVINNEAVSDLKIEENKDLKIGRFNQSLDEFAVVYLNNTAIKPFISNYVRSDLIGKISNSLARTANVANYPEPTFTFSHIILPHPPYLFDKDGEIKGAPQVELSGYSYEDRTGYIKQLEYTNQAAKSLINSILENSETEPIIIIASDHGSSQGLGQTRHWEPLGHDNVDGVKERMGNLSAFYFPKKQYELLTPDITPVNYFRVVLNQYFGQHLEILPNKSFYSLTNSGNFYEFTDVTDTIDR